MPRGFRYADFFGASPVASALGIVVPGATPIREFHHSTTNFTAADTNSEFFRNQESFCFVSNEYTCRISSSAGKTNSVPE
jgi:hypothetical protein